MTNKLKYFIGNWKMFGNLNSFRVIDQINVFCKKYSKYKKKYKVILCVPNTLIYYFSNKIRSNFVSIGAQNCHSNNDFGPYTGSVTAGMLKDVGAKYVILGHSENRLEGESDQEIKKKIESAIKEKLNVIFCIGETAKEKRNRKTFVVIKKQLNNSISKIKKTNKIIIAYEPRWSIGTGKIPKVSDNVNNSYESTKLLHCPKYNGFKIEGTPILKILNIEKFFLMLHWESVEHSTKEREITMVY